MSPQEQNFIALDFSSRINWRQSRWAIEAFLAQCQNGGPGRDNFQFPRRLGCEPGSLSEQLPQFRRIAVPSSSKHREPLAQRPSVTSQKIRIFLLVQNVAKICFCLPLSATKMKVLKHQFLTRIAPFLLHSSYSICSVDFLCQLHFH